MTKIEIDIPDRLANQITECKREPSEVIIEALNRHFDPSYQFTDLQRWQQHIEKKIQDLQLQLDDHRSNCTSDVGKDFDSDLWKRKTGEKSPLDTDEIPESERSLIGEVTEKKKRQSAPLDQISIDLAI
jgi:hypothetical protein